MGEIEWKLLTIGNLSRNKYWGESDSEAYHPVLATTTVIRDNGTVILVDPSQPFEIMKKKLAKYCCLAPEDVDVVFATHYHGDHRVDADKYVNAVCYMSQDSLHDFENFRIKAAGDKAMEAPASGNRELFLPAPSRLSDRVVLYPLPGHTPGLTGLMFESEKKRVLVAGDTIMGEEYFENRDGYWFNENLEITVQSILKAAEDADVIIPGHGDVFSVLRHMPGGERRPVALRRLNLPDKKGCTWLIRAGAVNLVLNPYGDLETLKTVLYDRSGLKGEDIDGVIIPEADRYDPQITELFPKAEILTAAGQALGAGIKEEWEVWPGG